MPPGSVLGAHGCVDPWHTLSGCQAVLAQGYITEQAGHFQFSRHLGAGFARPRRLPRVAVRVDLVELQPRLTGVGVTGALSFLQFCHRCNFMI